MAKHGKKYTDATTRFDREQLHAPVEALDLVKSLAHAQVRRDGRGGVPPRRRPPQGRPDDPRHRVAAERAPARTCASRCSPRATRPARPRRRVPTSSAPTTSSRDRGRLPRLRRRDRHARPHAAGRQARPHARPARPDAEPEDRHRHQRRRQGRRRVQGGQGRVPHRPVRQRARADRQGRASTPTRCSTNYQAVLDEMLRAKPAASKGRYIRASACRRRWARACGSTRPVRRDRGRRSRVGEPARRR